MFDWNFQNYSAIILLLALLCATNNLTFQAFADEELETTKQHLVDMQGYKETLDEMWRQARWTTDLIALAREKSYAGMDNQLCSCISGYMGSVHCPPYRSH